MQILEAIPKEQSPETLRVIQLVKGFLTFYETRRFVTMFIGSRPRPCVTHFETNCFFFYGEELLAPRSNPKLDDHPLSPVRDCLFNIFSATLHIWRLHPPSAT
jgi:hypothetical protein